MLPGKQFKPEDVLAILRRRIWILLVPAALIAVGTAVVARKLPDRFRSEAVILVVPQQVPEDYVRSTIRSDVETRLQTISQQILSRTRLERIIENFKLYPEERRTGIMQDVIDRMRLDIHVNVVKGDAFRVSYVGSNPRTVQQVTAAIASLFIEESLRDRSVLAEGTSQFLEVQLGDARRRLIEQEKKLEVYRQQFSGRLPSQLDANLQALQNVQLQIQATLESMNHDRDQQLVLQRQLADLQLEAAGDVVASSDSPTVVSPDAITGGTTAQQLAAAKNLLASLELRYKPDYPDIPRVRRLIRDLEKQLDAEALGQPVSVAGGPALSPKEQARAKRLQDLQAQLGQIDRRVLASQANEKTLRSRAAELQLKIDQVPARESEMTELTRDYSTLQTIYTGLLSKKEESNISANLERRQIGEQFKLLDPAQIAERPFSPDRTRISLVGLVAGLAVGLGLILLLEYRDTSFKTDEEITSLLSLPVLAVLPVMQSATERRRDVRKRLFVGFGLGGTVVACFAVFVYTFVR